MNKIGGHLGECIADYDKVYGNGNDNNEDNGDVNGDDGNGRVDGDDDDGG